jgi:hypothetical protein
MQKRILKRFLISSVFRHDSVRTYSDERPFRRPVENASEPDHILPKNPDHKNFELNDYQLTIFIKDRKTGEI